jgi:hypothetical protein
MWLGPTLEHGKNGGPLFIPPSLLFFFSQIFFYYFYICEPNYGPFTLVEERNNEKSSRETVEMEVSVQKIKCGTLIETTTVWILNVPKSPMFPKGLSPSVVLLETLRGGT